MIGEQRMNQIKNKRRLLLVTCVVTAGLCLFVPLYSIALEKTHNNISINDYMSFCANSIYPLNWSTSGHKLLYLSPDSTMLSILDIKGKSINNTGIIKGQADYSPRCYSFSKDDTKWAYAISNPTNETNVQYTLQIYDIKSDELTTYKNILSDKDSKYSLQFNSLFWLDNENIILVDNSKGIWCFNILNQSCLIITEPPYEVFDNNGKQVLDYLNYASNVNIFGERIVYNANKDLIYTNIKSKVFINSADSDEKEILDDAQIISKIDG